MRAGLCIRALGLALLAGPVSADTGKILTDASRADLKRAALEQGLDTTSDWLSAVTGKTISGPFLTLGSDKANLTPLLDEAYVVLEKPRPKIRVDVEVLCDGARANAVATVDFILFCWPEKAPIRPGDPRLGTVMAHELFHQLQYDLAGVRDERRKPGAPRRLGPAWMVEGSAEVIEYLFQRGSLPQDGADLFDLQTPARKSRLTLAELSEHGSINQGRAYGVARFAAYLLAREHGIDGLLSYFEGLGKGKSQDAAFEDAFDQSRESFQTAFEALRRSYSGARDWGEEP